MARGEDVVDGELGNIPMINVPLMIPEPKNKNVSNNK